MFHIQHRIIITQTISLLWRSAELASCVAGIHHLQELSARVCLQTGRTASLCNYCRTHAPLYLLISSDHVVNDLIYIFNKVKYRRVYSHKIEHDPNRHVGDYCMQYERYAFHVMRKDVVRHMIFMITFKKFLYFSSVRLDHA